MAPQTALTPSAKFGQKLRARGGLSAAKCYQCGTCSSVCDLAPEDAPFPRRQMLLAQWGQADKLMADPAVWLCHQCNDCSLRCPRDVKPGDVMRSLRALMIEQLSVPAFMGRLVANVRSTWPILLGVPILFWALLMGVTGHLGEPEHIHGASFAYHDMLPWGYLYCVYFPVAAFVVAAFWAGGVRFWKGLQGAEKRQGSLLAHLVPVLIEICTHKRFNRCGVARSRSWAHLALLWGFVGAAATSGLLIVDVYIIQEPQPLALWHPLKLLGNASALLLVVGGAALVYNRLYKAESSGGSTAFDHFFLWVVALVIVSGVLVEGGRFTIDLTVCSWLYVIHLGSVLCLFLTSPYCKFAHLVYRTLALVHERMTTGAAAEPSKAGT